MSTELGVAYLSITAETSKIAPNVNRALTSAEGGAEASGKRIGGKMSSGIGSGLGKVAGLVGGMFAVDKIGDFFSASIDGARESAKVTATTDATIKAMGLSAKVTSTSVGDLANSISLKTGIDDEAIQTGANQLLTFGKIRNELGKGNQVFDRATQAAVDLSAHGFGSIDSASVMLGKALNDPVKGITALQRVGVSLTEAQKKQVKSLVATGDALGAQKIILKAVEGQVGGTAAAQSTAADRAKVAYGNLQEKIGGALLPALEKVSAVVADRIVPAVSKFINGMQNGTGEGGKFAATAKDIASKVSTVVTALAPHWKQIVALVGAYAAFKTAAAGVNAVKGGIDSIKTAVDGVKGAYDGAKKAAGAFKDGLNAGAKLASGGQFETFGAAAKNAGTRMAEMGRNAAKSAADGARAAGSWVASHTRMAASAVATAAKNTAAWVASTARAGAAMAAQGLMAVASAAKSAAAWVVASATTVASLAAQGVAFAASKVAMAASAVASGVMTAAQWALNAAMAANPITLVVIAIAALVAAVVIAYKNSETFRNIVNKAFAMVKTVVMGVVNWLRTAVPAAFQWIKSAFLKYTPVGIIISHWGQIKDFIGSAVNRVRNVIQWFGNLPGLLGKWFGGAKDSAASAVNGLLDTVRSIPGRIMDALSNLGGMLRDAGSNIINALAEGIRNAVGAATGAVGSVLSSVRNLLPFSPAKEGPFSGRGWALYSGQSISEALGQGITDSAGAPTSAASAMMRSTREALALSSKVQIGAVPARSVAQRGGFDKPGAVGGFASLSREDAIAALRDGVRMGMADLRSTSMLGGMV